MRSILARVPSAAAAIGVVLVMAGPASAHEEITPATVPTGKPVFLTLNAANERSTDLTRITLRPPQGVSFGVATQQPPGWTADRSPTAITWTGGTVEPDSFAEWGFEIEAVGQPGPLRFTVDLGFADGSTDDSQAEVTAEGAPVPVTTAPPSTTGPAVTSGSSPAPSPASTDESSAEGRANAALVVAIVAALLALVAIVVAGRRRPQTAAGAPSGAGSTEGGTAKEQDW